MDMRVYLNANDQLLLDSAVSIKPLDAEILKVCIDVEPLQFNRGFYTVDVRFCIKTSYDVFTGLGCGCRPQRIEGLSIFDKRVILFGSEGSARMFSSRFVDDGPDNQLPVQTNVPVATVEVLDPILLSAKIVDACECCGCCQCELGAIPEVLNSVFGGFVDNDCGKKLYATMGFFSIIRLMRKVQIIVPSYDFCIPEKECCGPSEEDPCSLFYKMSFPTDEFFPPRLADLNCGDTSTPCDDVAGTNTGNGHNNSNNSNNNNNSGCGCGCGCHK